jgi:hypothetical protein
MRVVVAGMFSAVAADLAAAQNWTTFTLYDVLQEDCRQNISNKDLGDPAGAFAQAPLVMLLARCVRFALTRALPHASRRQPWYHVSLSPFAAGAPDAADATCCGVARR